MLCGIKIWCIISQLIQKSEKKQKTAYLVLVSVAKMKPIHLFSNNKTKRNEINFLYLNIQIPCKYYAGDVHNAFTLLGPILYMLWFIFYAMQLFLIVVLVFLSNPKVILLIRQWLCLDSIPVKIENNKTKLVYKSLTIVRTTYFWTGLGTIHDCMASIYTEWITQAIQTLLGYFVT